MMQEKIKNIKIGKKLTGEITGVVNFGLFIKVKISENEEMEGLVHISEASWEHIDDLTKHFTVGQKIDVEVISTENNRLSLSIKRLQPDPWLKEAEGFEVGKTVEGTVTKITPFGAFVKVGSIDGLVHISELGEKITDAHEVVSEGKSYQFKVTAIEPELHKLSLSIKDKQKDEKIKMEKPKKEINKTKKVKKGEA